MLSPDNTTRQNAETQLNQIRDSQPVLYATGLFQLLASCPDPQVKKFSAVQLKNSVSEFCPKSYKNIWNELDQFTQETFKTKLFEMLVNETSVDVRSQICDLIGELGGSLTEQENNNKWPNLLPTVF